MKFIEKRGGEAVKLRRYDDDGKVAGLTINPVEHYRPLLESLLTS